MARFIARAGHNAVAGRHRSRWSMILARALVWVAGKPPIARVNCTF